MPPVLAASLSRCVPSLGVQRPDEAASTAAVWLLPNCRASRYSKSAWPNSGSSLRVGFRRASLGREASEEPLCLSETARFLISSSGMPAVSSHVRPDKTWSSTVASGSKCTASDVAPFKRGGEEIPRSSAASFCAPRLGVTSWEYGRARSAPRSAFSLLVALENEKSKG